MATSSRRTRRPVVLDWTDSVSRPLTLDWLLLAERGWLPEVPDAFDNAAWLECVEHEIWRGETDVDPALTDPLDDVKEDD